MSILDNVVQALRSAAVYNRHDQAAPEVVLWTDGEGLWSKTVDALLGAMPELLVFDVAAADERRGPSTWLRYRLAKQGGDATPVIYLPGVARQNFRGAAGFPGAAKHLFALQHQGQFWTQQNGKDWTPFAFLTSREGGLGLSVARDRATSDAIEDQLENLLTVDAEQLRSHHLEASDFHKLVAGDPHGMLLQWLGAPDAVRARWGADRWSGFVAVCKETFGFDPAKDGQLTALERLVAGGGAWDDAWERYAQSPKTYGGLRSALDLVQPKDLFSSGSGRIPSANKAQESTLRAALKALAELPYAAAREALATLAASHVHRAASVWHELGEAPLASAAAQLGILAELVKQGAASHDWADVAASYTDLWWRIDAASWKALATVREPADMAAVSAALRAVYLPWLNEVAARVEPLANAYPNVGPASPASRALTPAPGTVVVFVDGLRCDLGFSLARMLEGLNLSSQVETGWSALPTVTSTAKPAWRPLAGHLNGSTLSEAFEPQSTDGKPLKSQTFRALLADVGMPWLDAGSVGDPSSSAWTEAGAFDRYGHDDGARMAWRIDEELRSVVFRIRDLIDAGWKKVVVTTDHGWLLMPGGLPSVSLPGHMTTSKWGRCAIAHPGAKHGFKEVPWFWNGAHSVVLPPGIHTFRAGMEYAHGGLTVQEALIPLITVSAAAGVAGAAVSIESVTWKGLRAQLRVSGDSVGITIDLRTKPADPASSVLPPSQRGKAPDPSGRISILVENDDLLGTAAVMVALRDGSVVAKQTVTIGDN